MVHSCLVLTTNCSNFPHLWLMIMASITIHWFLVPRILAELVFPGKNKTVLNACNGRFFALDKLKSHISKGKSEEEERRRRETALLAFLVFILATLWLWLDRRGLFGGTFLKIRLDIFSLLMKNRQCMKRHKSSAY